MGRGFTIVTSEKQNINTQSSTESELVGVDNLMPAICWTRYFMEAQGYGVDDTHALQDNRSSILLEKNGKASSSKRTKHINSDSVELRVLIFCFVDDLMPAICWTRYFMEAQGYGVDDTHALQDN